MERPPSRTKAANNSLRRRRNSCSPCVGSPIASSAGPEEHKDWSAISIAFDHIVEPPIEDLLRLHDEPRPKSSNGSTHLPARGSRPGARVVGPGGPELRAAGPDSGRKPHSDRPPDLYRVAPDRVARVP